MPRSAFADVPPSTQAPSSEIFSVLLIDGEELKKSVLFSFTKQSRELRFRVIYLLKDVHLFRSLSPYNPFRIGTMPIYGVRSRFIGKRHEQHMEQVVLSWFTKLCEPYRHFFMLHHRLCPVCAEDAVPPREVESKIAVCFADGDGMVHPVLVRRDNQQSEVLVEL